MEQVAILAGGLVLDGQITDAATVTVATDRIVGVADGHHPITGHTFDASAHLVAPGLIDVHTHGANGVEAVSATATDLARLSAFYATRGVTGYLATLGGSLDRLTAGLVTVGRYVNDGHLHGARCLGIHLEGPFLNPELPGAFQPGSLLPPSLTILEQLVAASGDTIRLITLAPELPGADELIRWAVTRGIRCSAGHTSATTHDIDRAIELGLTGVTHTCNAMPPFHHRAPGTLGAVLFAHELTLELIADGIHLHPDTVRMIAAAAGPQRIALITDSVSAAGLPDGQYHLEEQHVTVAHDSARLADGTLAGGCSTLDRVVDNFEAWTGVSRGVALACGSLVSARHLGVPRGIIAPGTIADLAGFDDHGVAWTMVEGQIVFQRR